MQTKLRSDAWEAALTAETRQELYRLTKPRAEGEPEDRPWLRDFDRDVLPYLSLQGIVAPGRSSWYRFLGRMREEEAAKTIISVETSKRIAQGIQALCQLCQFLCVSSIVGNHVFDECLFYCNFPLY